MLWALFIVFGYLLGSVPTGILVGRVYGVDVRKVGSGNIGTANVLRAAGKSAAVLTLVGDMIKGLLPVVVARLVLEETPLDHWAIAGVALAAVVGHCWPVFLHFHGGKGVATGAGTTVGLVPPIGLAMFGLWWVIALVTRYTSLAAIVVMVVSPIVFVLTGQPLPYTLYTIIGGALVIWLHRENVRALLKGTERKFGKRLENDGE